jgi:hypothetical protein
MQFKTLGNLVLGVERRLSQVPGTGVQLYAEDTIVQLIQNGFNALFTDTFWPHLCVWEQNVVDGSTGTLTSDFTYINSFYDIQSVYVGTTDAQLRILPSNFNPFKLTGTSALYMEAIAEDVDENRLFKVYPITATSTLYVYGRAHPGNFTSSSTIVKMDAQALELYAAWKYLSDDGSNPGQIEDVKKEFTNRLQQLKVAMNSKPIDINPNATSVYNNGWTEVG